MSLSTTAIATCNKLVLLRPAPSAANSVHSWPCSPLIPRDRSSDAAIRFENRYPAKQNGGIARRFLSKGLKGVSAGPTKEMASAAQDVQAAVARGEKAPRFMVVSDLDNTMVDHKDPGNYNLLRFASLWQAEYSHDSLLVYSTGRSPTLYKQLRSEVPLITPGITIMSVGTEIMYGDTMTPDAGWEEELNKGWDRSKILDATKEFTVLRPQVESEQRPHKLSFHIEKEAAKDVIPKLQASLDSKGLKAKIIYSGGYDLDILAAGAGKGEALAYLLRKFRTEGRSPGNVLVCGDSGNDAELFTVPEVNGVLVSNAMEELVHWYDSQEKKDHIFRATERCAGGIIEAMKHFNFKPYVAPRDKTDDPSLPKDALAHLKDSTSAVRRAVINMHVFLERWYNGEVENSEEALAGFRSTAAPGYVGASETGEATAEEVEARLKKAYNTLRVDGEPVRIWVDRLKQNELSPGVFLVTYEEWQRVAKGGPVTARLVSAIWRTKEGGGVECLRSHSSRFDTKYQN